MKLQVLPRNSTITKNKFMSTELSSHASLGSIRFLSKEMKCGMCRFNQSCVSMPNSNTFENIKSISKNVLIKQRNSLKSILFGINSNEILFPKLESSSRNSESSTRCNAFKPHNLKEGGDHFDSKTSTTKPLNLSSDELPEAIAKEKHKYFDQVEITVKSGDGGHGSILSLPRSSTPSPSPGLHGRALRKKVQEERIKRRSKSVMKRSSEGDVILPVGGNGGDVILFADENVDDLLDLHRKKSYRARRGGNVSSVDGLTRKAMDGSSIPPLRIPVPVGTVVKKKRGGKFIADLSKPGDEVTVARGGRGGLSILTLPDENQNALRPRSSPHGVTFMSKADDKSLTYGLNGEEIALELILRVVADVGLVGFPNAGKSSLLACVTRAKPDIASYPFTTLIPNLGKLKDATSAPQDNILKVREEEVEADHHATIADLPGLIEGAHAGKGLGRMFLRHLRRAQLLVHLVDANGQHPITDYLVLREELRMYNPNYISRPHILVFNKIDLLDPNDSWKIFKDRILTSLQEIEHKKIKIGSNANDEREEKEEKGEIEKEETELNGRVEEVKNMYVNDVDGDDEEEDSKFERQNGDEKELFFELSSSPPLAILGISAKENMGIEEFLECIRLALAQENSRTDQTGSAEAGIRNASTSRGRRNEFQTKNFASGEKITRAKPPSWHL